MQKATYTPEVKPGHAFREISQDFAKPAEIFREAIANSLDAYATNIWLRVQVVNVKSRDKVVIYLGDDGIGMNAETIKSFLNLSDSSKPATAPVGMVKRRMTGYKGHGTKVYFNSESVEVLSRIENELPVYCRLNDPRGHLSEGTSPTAEIEELSIEELLKRRTEWGFAELKDGQGTIVRVTGYHDNTKKGLEHVLLVDYVRWFTRWGSWEPKLRIVTNSQSDEVSDFSRCSLHLRGLAKPSPDTDEKLGFGHMFPAEDCTDIKKLRGKDDADPLKHYVRTWAFANEPLANNPDKTIDFLFALEGEGARREYNEMLRRQGRPRRPGDYLSQERYGLWLGRDYVPVQRFNSWVAEQSEYTRMHAFVNCNNLNLTANRGSVENTPQELLEDIQRTVEKLFEQIQSDNDYVKFLDELLAVERQRHASREVADYKRRLKRLEAKQYCKIKDIEFLSPTTESDLIALVSGVQALIPDILPFVVRDYDSHFGFDGLATRSKELAIAETKHLFVEFKTELKPDFNHTFEHLEAVICWTSKVKDGTEVVDLGGRKGTYTISTNAQGTKSRYIVIPNARQNVEVILFKELLESKGFAFKPIGE
ncbi:MAG: ATP-binding protein [Pirellulales bacterium]